MKCLLALFARKRIIKYLLNNLIFVVVLSLSVLIATIFNESLLWRNVHNHYGLYCNYNVDLYLHLYLCTLIMMVSDGVDVVCRCLPRSSIDCVYSMH